MASPVNRFTRTVLLRITVLSVSVNSFGQINFKEGYLIVKGDTLRGSVDYRNWKENPKVVTFRNSAVRLASTALHYENDYDLFTDPSIITGQIES